MRSSFGVLCVWVALSAHGCGAVGHDDPPRDGSSMESPGIDAPAIDASADLGTREYPARSCAELAVAGSPSGAYWVRHPVDANSTFQVYCEQQLNGGGWAMLENSVRRDDGTTTAFWQFKYDDRLKQLGTLAAEQNYYDGGLYLIGTEYMDVIVDLQDTTIVAALVTATGFNPSTMQFVTPTRVGGNVDIFTRHFAGGWSAQDRDLDLLPNSNCSTVYANVAQHYDSCWTYSLGADADEPLLDGGVGPHVHNDVLTSLGLALQPEGGTYSQVKRIARFTRW